MRHAYAKAPFFRSAIQLFEDVINSDDDFIAAMAKNSIKQVASHLRLNTKFIATSTTYNNGNLSGAERVVDICRIETAARYVNLVGGKALYQTQQFSDSKVTLNFLSPELKPLQPVPGRFHRGLSIIDLLMHYNVDTIREMLSLVTLENACTGQVQDIRNGNFHVQ